MYFDPKIVVDFLASHPGSTSREVMDALFSQLPDEVANSVSGELLTEMERNFGTIQSQKNNEGVFWFATKSNRDPDEIG